MQIIEDATSYINSTLEPFSAYSLFGNTGSEYIIALFVFFTAIVFFAIVQKVIIVRLNKLADKTKTDLDDTLISIVRGIRPAFYSFAAIYLASRTLSLHPFALKGLSIILVIWIAVQVVFALQKLIDYSVNKRSKIEEDESTNAAYSYLANIAKALLWVFAILGVLANFGVNITSVLAGLGIAGIAVGLALQNILGDLFSSFAIYFDKPFVKGDVISIGEHTGTVEHVGIKTTRIRALQGEEIVISNQELTSSRVQNFRKLEERRVKFNFGILYETPLDKVKKVPSIIENIIHEIKNARIDRVHFSDLGDSALIFEVIYFVSSNKYVDKMDVQQKINTALMEKLNKEGISFAYPTQKIFLSK
jgi:small-conductance mechanosensitive channel